MKGGVNFSARNQRCVTGRVGDDPLVERVYEIATKSRTWIIFEDGKTAQSVTRDPARRNSRARMLPIGC